MDEPGHGILGREAELAQVRSFLGSVSGGSLGAAPGGSGRDRQDDAVAGGGVLGAGARASGAVLSRGRVGGPALEPVLAFLDAMGSPEPGVVPCLPDAIEALISVGRLDEAEGLIDRLERQGRALDRPWAIATAGRGRGLLTAARGDLPAARSALEQALVEHRRVPQPFELARTLLVQGEVGRRAKQKRAARSSLEQALGLFLALGAPLWAQRARDDLARAGGPAPPSSELTPTASPQRVSPDSSPLHEP